MDTIAIPVYHTIKRPRAMEFLANETGGRILSAHFQKRDGSMRRMVCRRGVKRHLKGGQMPYDAIPRQLVPVWDVQAKGYRILNVAELFSFRIGGENFLVVD